MRAAGDGLGRWHLETRFYSIILVHGLGSLPCRFSPEKIPFLCPNILWILHSHQLGWKGLCCCDKQFCSLVKWVLEWPLPHILSAHCLGGSTFGQHKDTIPCCAELQSFTIASLCRREPGTWPRPFPKLLILCCGLQELLCPRLNRGASSPFHPKMQALGRGDIPLCAVAWGHGMSWEGWAGQWCGLAVSSRESAAAGKPGRAKSPGVLWLFPVGFPLPRNQDTEGRRLNRAVGARGERLSWGRWQA